MTWYKSTATDVARQLAVETTTGLAASEAQQRLGRYGANELIDRGTKSPWKILWEQFTATMVLILIAAAVISMIVGDLKDAVAILAIVVLFGLLGFVQEYRAEQAMAALRKMSVPNVRVRRDGTVVETSATQLVPGDVVLLEAGNVVPADGRLIESANLRIQEAALTGESEPIEKDPIELPGADRPLGDRKNMAYMGTLVTYGRGSFIVTDTGMQTELGKIATLIQSVAQELTPLQKRLDQLGKGLALVAVAVAVLIFALGALRGEPLNLMFMTAVSVAVAAVPEGLPAVVTITLALGAKRMLKRQALIRKLPAVETLGSVTVICSDKTGTLTQNEMTVTRMWVDGQFVEITGTGYSPDGEFQVDGKKVNTSDYPGVQTALWIGVLNNDADLEYDEQGNFVRMVGDPTEGSILVAAAKAGALPFKLNRSFPRDGEIPFDSTRKRMVTVHLVVEPHTEDISLFTDNPAHEHFVVAVKGAPDMVLNLCTRYHPMDNSTPQPMTDDRRREILAANDTLTRGALRVLGLAYRVSHTPLGEYSTDVLEQDLVFVGLVGMIDPARPEVAPALQEARQAGIRTIMITGDYPNTACAIAEQITLLEAGGQALTGRQLDEMDDAALEAAVKKISVFARVSPEHKMRIVKALQADQQVVAMTGDGVNDAPAIKLADIGVAMGITGTDVAKETADMVLTDDNYASIVSAVEQGRIIYSNIRKFVYYLISCNMGEIFVIFIPTLLGKGSPLQAIQLLWLNLVTDGAPALALGTEKGDPDIMQQKPRPAGEPIINRDMYIGVAIQAFFITATTLAAFFIGLAHNEAYAQTMAFTTLSISELFRAYTARSEYYSIIKIGIFGNKFMNYAVGASLLLILLVLYIPFLNTVFKTVPLGWAEWIRILPLILIPSVAAELTKYFLKRSK